MMDICTVMSHRIICAIGPHDWSSSIGKLGSDTSFSTYALKRDETIVSIIEPSKFPEKIWSLLFSIYLGDEIYILLDDLNRNTAEVLLSLDLMGKTDGFISVDDRIDPDTLDKVLKDNVVENYIPFEPDPAIMRERLFDLPLKHSDAPLTVVVDQAFNVKGIGCVVLGFVMSGTVKKHQEISVLQGSINTQIRSIQIHDKDVKEAPRYSRVGLALKNVDPEQLKRGTILTDDGSLFNTGQTLTSRMRVSPFWKARIEPGMRFHAHHGLQFSPCEVMDTTPQEDGFIDMTLEFESPFSIIRGGLLGLVNLDSKTFRLFASGETI